ncbi:MAG: MBL fold metallo-hydrolase, partial [Calditrichaeota bacterium]
MAHRKAVSVILTRDPGSTEVYLAERSPKLRFFGGFYAFPGGTLDDEDLQVEIKNAETVPAHWLPYLVAAAREIFEETGLLLAHSATMPDKEKQARYRQALLAGDLAFQEILKRERLEIDAADFHHVCAILTPEFSPVRYDTQFYWVQVPDGASPDIWPGELVRGEFYSADQALAAWRRGEMLIVPPVIFMLQELSGHSLEEAAPRIDDYAEAYRRGKIHQVYFTPGVQLVALNTRTLLPATHTNAYLVGERHLYIIDPAPSDPGEQARLWDYLDDRLAEGCSFEGILLTHHHSDHIGAVEACQKRYQLPLFAHGQTAQKLPQFHFAGFLDDGDTLDLGEAPDGRPGWKLHVYHTPGHASGHLAFREDRYGAVIAGDLVSTLSTIVISPPDG